MVSVSVSFFIWMLRGINPSAGTGNSISSIIIFSSSWRDTLDRRGSISLFSSNDQLHGFRFRCITDTWTVFLWSSCDSGSSLYVDIFSYKTKTIIDNNPFELNPLGRIIEMCWVYHIIWNYTNAFCTEKWKYGKVKLIIAFYLKIHVFIIVIL